MDEFKIELSRDEELLELIWINYVKNRNEREKIASMKWNELFRGDTSNFSEIEFTGLNSLNKFSNFSKDNKELSNKLIKKYFLLIRENINLKILGNSDKNIHKSQKTENQDGDDYFRMWDELNKIIEEEFTLEYEKMKRISEVFKDVSLFSQVGWDLSKFSKEDMFVISKLDETLVNRKEITLLLDKIGKISMPEASKILERNKKLPHFVNEYIGVTLDNDLARLLASELTYMHNPLLKKLFYIKYMEKRLLTYSMKAPEDKTNRSVNEIIKSKGPIIICIDTSSSMAGLPEEIAKSIVLYTLKKALSENREVYLIAFGSINEILEYNLTNEKNGLFLALNFLKKGFYGGTDFVSPLLKSFQLIEDKAFEKSDLLFITDGLGKLPIGFINDINQKKMEKGTKIFSILLSEKVDDLEFSDETLLYQVKGNKEFRGIITVYDKIGHYEFLDKH